MKCIRFLTWIFVAALVLVACAQTSATPAQTPPSSPQASEPTSEVKLAEQALKEYFNALNAGDYQRALDFYGGTFDVLTGYNPDISPDDHAALFEAGCRYNGLLCNISLRSLVKKEQTSPAEFKFTVEFNNAQGQLFQLGPCCGADPTTNPPVSRFEYTVVRQGEQYRVLELPVYQP